MPFRRVQPKTVVHVFTGFAAGLLNALDPLVALQAVLLFLWYELLEQLRIGDLSYADTLEFAVGWGVGVVAAMLV